MFVKLVGSCLPWVNLVRLRYSPNIEGLTHFNEILQEADGIILSRANLGLELPLEKVFLFKRKPFTSVIWPVSLQ
ncbi:pyruvate kinase 1, cytosolic-like [Papaver somniferum]|uniref:pyruvate kinase 1, cytosolic-like n=1 Tax=Papaver somniferum TaxID=3469 RepID=UPI000E6F4670|nr:pyruvate kinase 1, cytosolic-like [Papaver somniferum]